jgi:hypothetical protein
MEGGAAGRRGAACRPRVRWRSAWPRRPARAATGATRSGGAAAACAARRRPRWRAARWRARRHPAVPARRHAPGRAAAWWPAPAPPAGRWPRRTGPGAAAAAAPSGGQLVGEAFVQQAVGLVQHQQSTRRAAGVAADQVQQPARRGDDTSAPPRRPSICGLTETPPKTTATFTRVGRWRASARRSRRPARELARGHQHQRLGAAPAGRRVCSSRCSRARPKAAVLPEPVCAQPMTSRPCSAGGMAAAWIGVGSCWCGAPQSGRCGSRCRAGHPRSANPAGAAPRATGRVARG